MAGLMNRMNTVIKAKMSKMLDRAEDPNETLDYSYQKQLEMLQKVKQGIATVVTSKKRLQLQTAKLEQSVVTLESRPAPRSAPAARTSRARRSSARRWSSPAAGPGRPDRRPRGRAAAPDRERAPAERQGRDLPDAQGGHQGAVHRRRGDRPHRRGPDGPVRGDGRRRALDPARRGQDRADARAGRSRRRARRHRRAGRRLTPGQSDLDRQIAQLTRPPASTPTSRDEARARHGHGERRHSRPATARRPPASRGPTARAPKEDQP